MPSPDPLRVLWLNSEVDLFSVESYPVEDSHVQNPSAYYKHTGNLNTALGGGGYENKKSNVLLNKS